MIERFPQGINHVDVTAEVLAACGDLPVLIWNSFLKAYASVDGITIDAARAARYTLAQAYFAGVQGRPRVVGHPNTYQPIDYIRLDLPLPTSGNALFVEAAGRRRGTGRQRVKTKEYRDWQEAAGWALKPQLTAQGAAIQPDVPTFGKHWALWIRLNIDHQGDVTNRVKALEDLLVAWNITTGDQWNDKCIVERDRSIDVECRVIIYRKVQHGN